MSYSFGVKRNFATLHNCQEVGASKIISVQDKRKLKLKVKFIFKETKEKS